MNGSADNNGPVAIEGLLITEAHENILKNLSGENHLLPSGEYFGSDHVVIPKPNSVEGLRAPFERYFTYWYNPKFYIDVEELESKMYPTALMDHQRLTMKDLKGNYKSAETYDGSYDLSFVLVRTWDAPPEPEVVGSCVLPTILVSDCGMYVMFPLYKRTPSNRYVLSKPILPQGWVKKLYHSMLPLNKDNVQYYEEVLVRQFLLGGCTTKELLKINKIWADLFGKVSASTDVEDQILEEGVGGHRNRRTRGQRSSPASLTKANSSKPTAASAPAVEESKKNLVRRFGCNNSLGKQIGAENGEEQSKSTALKPTVAEHPKKIPKQTSSLQLETAVLVSEKTPEPGQQQTSTTVAYSSNQANGQNHGMVHANNHGTDASQQQIQQPQQQPPETVRVSETTPDLVQQQTSTTVAYASHQSNAQTLGMVDANSHGTDASKQHHQQPLIQQPQQLQYQPQVVLQPLPHQQFHHATSMHPPAPPMQGYFNPGGGVPYPNSGVWSYPSIGNTASEHQHYDEGGDSARFADMFSTSDPLGNQQAVNIPDSQATSDAAGTPARNGQTFENLVNVGASSSRHSSSRSSYLSGGSSGSTSTPSLDQNVDSPMLDDQSLDPQQLALRITRMEKNVSANTITLNQIYQLLTGSSKAVEVIADGTYIKHKNFLESEGFGGTMDNIDTFSQFCVKLRDKDFKQAAVACYTVTYGLDAAKTAGDVGNFTTDMVTCGYSWGENPRNIGNIGYHVSRIMANKFFGKGLLQQITGQTTDGKYTLEGNFPEFRLLMDDVSRETFKLIIANNPNSVLFSRATREHENMYASSWEKIFNDTARNKRNRVDYKNADYLARKNRITPTTTANTDESTSGNSSSPGPSTTPTGRKQRVAKKRKDEINAEQRKYIDKLKRT